MTCWDFAKCSPFKKCFFMNWHIMCTGKGGGADVTTSQSLVFWAMPVSDSRAYITFFLSSVNMTTISTC